LAARWTFTAGSEVSATPTVIGDRVYVPDWSGNLYCLRAATGRVVWRKKVLDYVMAVDPLPSPPDSAVVISRTSPAVAGDRVVIGVMNKGGGLPYLMAVRTSNGELIWGRRVDPHRAAIITQVSCNMSSVCITWP
jgi:polyvinyl alcohol dehydrogenase (cytochrome)